MLAWMLNASLVKDIGDIWIYLKATDLYLSVVSPPGVGVVAAQPGTQVGCDEQDVSPKLDIVIWITLWARGGARSCNNEDLRNICEYT